IATVSVFFFFSSRRRHTRFSRDWSSDVCSSDLAEARVAAAEQIHAAAEAALENTRVRAPFTGTVLRKDAEVGEVVAPSVAGTGRSEERRVGKECRCRWPRCH